MGKKWVVKAEPDAKSVSTLQNDLHLNPHIAKLLIQRNLKTKEQVERFFNPSLAHLYDPFLMKDMDKAIERIEKAIETKEKILIYGDYDVDGTTAVAVLYSFLKHLDAQLDFYIPDRYADGYGLSMRSIDYAAERGISLMITLDCGIKANEQVEYAKSKNIDIIISDHHRPGDVLPDALAVLDPKRSDCNYPYKELSGCGVGFKIAQAYCRKHGLDETKLAYPLLDLVAISIASDIVPITDENRVLSYFGLKQINTAPRPGIEAILKYSNIKQNSPNAYQSIQSASSSNYFNKELTINDLVFLVGPRINAAGRIESGRKAVLLLLCDNLEEASLVGKKINDFNTERKCLDHQATQEALSFLQNNEFLKDRKSTVVFDASWSKGVIGIVASRLTETYYRPTIVFTESNGALTGSARSVKGFDIYDAIEACSDLLEHFGGHKYAAGLSIKPENFEAFRDRFERNVCNFLKGEKLVPEIEIDSIINISDITSDFYRELKKFAPFGPGNMNPVFASYKVKDSGNARIVGGNNHLKISIFQMEPSSFPMNGIAFQLGHYCDCIQRGQSFNVCYHIEENEWNGNISLQLNVKDIRID